MSTTTVTTISPDDVRGWRHGDAKFLMLLSGACGWTARLEANKGAKLRSKSGQTMLIPDNTGLRIGVFRGWASKLITHAERRPSAKAVFELMEETKLDPAHRRVAWDAIGIEPYMPSAPGTVAETTDRYKVMNQGRTVFTADDPAAAIELATDAVTAESGPYKVIEIATAKLFATVNYTPPTGGGERVVTRIVPWQRKDGATSHAVMERTWSDGTVDYACSFDGCDFTADTPMKIGAHYRLHQSDRAHWKKRGSKTAPPAAAVAAPEPVVEAVAEFTPMAVSGGGSHVERDQAPSAALLDGAAMKLERIVEIVAPAMLAEMAALRHEAADANARADAAEQKLATLRSLITGSV